MDATAWASFWAFMALIAFLGILVYLKVPAMAADWLDSRAERIRRDLDEARRLREEAQALLADYQRRRQEAEEEAEAIVDQARREAEAIATEAQLRMGEYIERRTRLVEQRIGQAEVQAIAEVRSRAVDVAAEAATRILSERGSGETGQRLVRDSIEQVRSNLN
ncbi:F0F1 ATP synthase subunit B family protein [Faunimonas sp. B44]|uniref:F0F1 ATP synthase subunit B family protein n=1 Tax=Faunimonas sp. B44 TaxID=3461493 RepID=UPI004043C6A3